MQHSQCEGYLISHDFRRYFFASHVVVSTSFTIFSMLMLCVAFKDGSEALACIIIAFLFLILAIYIIYRKQYWSDLVNFRYSYNTDTIANNYANQCKLVSLCTPLFLTVIKIPFAVGNAKKHICFVAISATPFEPLYQMEYGGLTSVKKFWDSGILLLPDNLETKDFLSVHLKLNRLSEYPKVMFIHTHSCQGS